MSSVSEHRARAEGLGAVSVGVLTVSDTRDLATDRSGQLILDLVAEAGHNAAERRLVRDEPDQIRDAVLDLCRAGLDAVLSSGGTGIGTRDQTCDVVRPLLEKELPGYGELFRMLSWEEVGSAAMLSRAVAGTVGRTLVFCMPGSSNAVRLAMTRLILPELRHLVHELHR
ncbi:MAG: MogA/MoaB family molybdenum cofactor biosynthesis protein [Caldilineaceae bacterium]|uniref:Molybdenum cofactor biosynthesis protein B n=1 Tax=Caldilineaceae bacterium SB0662_bin_9 TaxID=2605258 RepID=A0A6B1DV92_9CHLR|nr:MogA/MoaB family molybdenum cofactor biosynthesis protein [Caldilineaceae bacterium]MXZ25105.1 MogA/MoaB family molybdenum cofactor biosynthesis protein [Caldilineaceae bacterium SB0665_bin_21]MXZ43349.1 MogA/MoaB family molybdenum cofactor biosynthesis protein [Caldilineaceae bacterium SB0666_bin_21]MYA04305.1 MogA/MoaB family molybdenum cofactor biosynthesis protein [Caldilineaceae bacterium SB0664_bin_22]MYC63411.1 MogA/MoaB family molybdenum cofactor biosynthesis protein [Caldilineaceae 